MRKFSLYHILLNYRRSFVDFWFLNRLNKLKSLVAQWLEHGSYEARVAGSIPVGTIFLDFFWYSSSLDLFELCLAAPHEEDGLGCAIYLNE